MEKACVRYSSRHFRPSFTQLVSHRSSASSDCAISPREDITATSSSVSDLEDMPKNAIGSSLLPVISCSRSTTLASVVQVSVVL